MEAHGRVTGTVGAGGTGKGPEPLHRELGLRNCVFSRQFVGGSTESNTDPFTYRQAQKGRKKSVPRAPGQMRCTVKQQNLASSA